VNRHTALAPQIQPAGLGPDPLALAPAGRGQRRRFVDPAAAMVAIDAGGRQVTRPGQPRQRGDVGAVAIEHRIARIVGRHGTQQMGGAG
jgi:hypothetical protein